MRYMAYLAGAVILFLGIFGMLAKGYITYKAGVISYLDRIAESYAQPFTEHWLPMVALGACLIVFGVIKRSFDKRKKVKG